MRKYYAELCKVKTTKKSTLNCNRDCEGAKPVAITQTSKKSQTLRVMDKIRQELMHKNYSSRNVYPYLLICSFTTLRSGNWNRNGTGKDRAKCTYYLPLWSILNRLCLYSSLSLTIIICSFLNIET